MYKVLIVEDDPMVAMINEQYVKKNRDYTVVGRVRDGKSAIEFLEKESVDLIILDVFMPIMDGLETIKRIREKGISVEAIMVTAANDRVSVEEALHFGAIDYLVKPFTFERFQLALQKFAVQKQAFGSMDNLNQGYIDSIIENKIKNDTELPKGIQERTLEILIDYLGDNKGAFLPGETIAEKTGLTTVTVRKYMSYLEEQGIVKNQMNYETGGRPCVLYSLKEE
ncbi:MAG: response regulator [Faecalimonas sp.]|nr:response regulator [Faecalimonas sp.]